MEQALPGSSPVVQLCVEGTRAEFAGRLAEAAALYRRAWETASGDYEACIAAHYVARVQTTVEDALRWNEEALRRADASGDARVRDFYPSLYLCLGRSYEEVGDSARSRRYYDLAAGLGFPHQEP